MTNAKLSEAEARSLVNDARGSRPDFRGRHMLNFRVRTSQGRAILRLPRSEFIGYDARMIAEGDAIEMAAGAGANVPRILFRHPEYLIETFIEGHAVQNSEWRYWLKELLVQVSLVRQARIGEPKGIRNIYEWQRWMRSFLLELQGYVSSKYAKRLDAVGLPRLDDVWTPDPAENGPITLVHADLHAENLLADADGRIWILDWELAVAADPVLEAATSVHRTKWVDERDRSDAAELWLASLHDVGNMADVRRRFEAYRTLEVWKSLLVDSVKYPNDIRDDPESLDSRASSFHRKLVVGHSLFGSATMSRDAVHDLLSEWTANE